MIYHIPFPFSVTFPVFIFGSEEVISILDFILIGTVSISTVYGFFRGFLSELFSLLSWLIALWAAFSFDENIVVIFGSFMASETFKIWLARALILAVMLFIGALVSKKATKTIGWSFAGNLLGGIAFGFLRGLIFVAIIIFMLEDSSLYGEPLVQNAFFLEEAEKISDFFYNFFLEHYNQ
jgi:membrane protein required for colicin V production